MERSPIQQRYGITVSLLFFTCLTNIAHADLPLTIEDLLTAEKRWRADVNLVYANSDRRNVDSRMARFKSVPANLSPYLSL